MKKQLQVLALLLVVGMAWATVNQVQTNGNYGVTENKIYIQHFQDSLWQDPASTGSYPVTWFNNDNSRKELIYVTGKTPTAGLTPAHVIATRGYGPTSPIEHLGPCSAYLVVLPTYTPTTASTATPTPTATNTPTTTPIPQGTAITSMAAGTPVPKFISNPGTSANTMWMFNQLGTDAFAAGAFSDVPGAAGNTLNSSAAVTYQWRVIY